MKQYISSAVFLLCLATVLVATAYQLDQFNQNLSKAMFSVPAPVYTVVLQ